MSRDRPVRSEGFPTRGAIGSEERAAVDAFLRSAFDSGRDIRYGGSEQRAYEREFARFHGGGHALLVSSGTAALYVALGALAPRRPGEVVVPAITDAGGIMPIPLLGLVPVVADTEPGSFNVGVRQIEAALSEWTRAIVVAHIGGDPVDMEPVMAMARRHRLPVIEDCSQAHGALYQGGKVGTFGDVAVYSTMGGKHHCTGGQGGVVLTRDRELYERILLFSDRGKVRHGEVTENVTAALNFNGSDLAAVIGRAQLAKLPHRLAARRGLAARLDRGLRALVATRLVTSGPGFESSYWFFRIFLDFSRLRVTRDEYLRALTEEGIPCGAWADIPATHPWFERQVVNVDSDSWPLRRQDLPRPVPKYWPAADEAAATHITLFVNERWTSKEIEDVCAALTRLEDAFLDRSGVAESM